MSIKAFAGTIVGGLAVIVLTGIGLGVAVYQTTTPSTPSVSQSESDGSAIEAIFHLEPVKPVPDPRTP